MSDTAYIILILILVFLTFMIGFVLGVRSSSCQDVNTNPLSGVITCAVLQQEATSPLG